jgi:hypothetical protein
MSEITAITFHDAVIEEYRRAVSARGSKTAMVDKQTAIAHAMLALQTRIHAGEIEVPIEDALHAALSAADARDGQAADNIIAQLARGELGLDLWPDPRLEIVVTLGAGKRKAWKHITAYDLDLMIELRKKNTNAARRAERRFIKDVASVYNELIAAGTVGALVAAKREAAVA